NRTDYYIFELKIDGFRSLAYIENVQCDLVSRNGNTFCNFKDLAEWIGEHLPVENAVINGEIAWVDDLGRSVFNDLLLRRRECVFFGFDLLFVNGEDLRAPLDGKESTTEEATAKETFTYALRGPYRHAWSGIYLRRPANLI